MRVTRFKPSQYTVKLGEFNLKEHDQGESEPLRVSAVKIHKGFPSRGFFNDIALLKLERPVTFTQTIQPICLPLESERSKTFADDVATVAGWGYTSYGNCTLHLVDTHKTSHEYPVDVYWNIMLLATK